MRLRRGPVGSDVAAELSEPCGCSVCRRYGTLWGYFCPDEVRVRGVTDIYSWGEKNLEFHRCPRCGCVTHWAPADATESRMAINGRLLEPADLAGVPVRQSPGPPD